MLTGDLIDGEAAHRLGLADVLTEPDDLLREARDIAMRMGANSPTALRMVKRLITENLGEPDLAVVQQREGRALAECYKSPEHKEAISAFIEKRKPNFR